MLPLFSKPFEDIVFKDIRQLIDESYPEGDTVEYKRELPSKGKDRDPWYEGKKATSWSDPFRRRNGKRK